MLKNKSNNFVLEQLQQHLFTDSSLEKITALVNEHNSEVRKAKNVDLICYEQELKQVNKKISNLANAIANGVAEDAIIEKINALNDTKTDLQGRINGCAAREIQPISTSEVKEALEQFKTFVKSNNTIEVRNFLRQYIEKVVVFDDTVEVVLRIATETDDSINCDNTHGKILADIEITKDDLKKYPKQKRKIIPQASNDNHLKEYRVVDD